MKSTILNHRFVAMFCTSDNLNLRFLKIIWANPKPLQVALANIKTSDPHLIAALWPNKIPSVKQNSTLDQGFKQLWPSCTVFILWFSQTRQKVVSNSENCLKEGLESSDTTTTTGLKTSKRQLLMMWGLIAFSYGTNSGHWVLTHTHKHTHSLVHA